MTTPIPTRRALLALALFMLLAPTAGAQTAAFQLIGHTTAAFPGDAGVPTFTLQCKLEFENDARMCSSQEVRESVTTPFLTEEAWVPATFASTGGGTPLDLLDLDSGNMTCADWTASGSFVRGLVFTPAGEFATRSCNVAHPVACCAPVTLPLLKP